MNDDSEEVNGPKIAADILNRMPAEKRKALTEAIQKKSPEAAQKIQESLFNFDDLLNISAQGLQVLLGAISQGDLVLSLKTASNEVRDILFSNMTERKKTQVQEDFALLPPVRLSEVEAAQKRILTKLDELRTAGLVRSSKDTGVWV